MRRRAAIWASFALIGLGLGTVHASGFATVGGEAGTASVGKSFGLGPDQDADAAALSELIRSNGDLRWSWDGQWGSIAERAMYTIDLDEAPAHDRFSASVVLANEPRGFSALQVQLRIVDAGPGAECEAEQMSSGAALRESNQRVMKVESADSQVTFAGAGGDRSGLPGATTYCVGVADYPGSGRDPDGTFLRRSGDGSFIGTNPIFVATLSRVS